MVALLWTVAVWGQYRMYTVQDPFVAAVCITYSTGTWTLEDLGKYL